MLRVANQTLPESEAPNTDSDTGVQIAVCGAGRVQMAGRGECFRLIHRSIATSYDVRHHGTSAYAASSLKTLSIASVSAIAAHRTSTRENESIDQTEIVYTGAGTMDQCPMGWAFEILLHNLLQH